MTPAGGCTGTGCDSGSTPASRWLHRHFSDLRSAARPQPVAAPALAHLVSAHDPSRWLHRHTTDYRLALPRTAAGAGAARPQPVAAPARRAERDRQTGVGTRDFAARPQPVAAPAQYANNDPAGGCTGTRVPLSCARHGPGRWLHRHLSILSPPGQSERRQPVAAPALTKLVSFSVHCAGHARHDPGRWLHRHPCAATSAGTCMTPPVAAPAPARLPLRGSTPSSTPSRWLHRHQKWPTADLRSSTQPVAAPAPIDHGTTPAGGCTGTYLSPAGAALDRDPSPAQRPPGGAARPSRWLHRHYCSSSTTPAGGCTGTLPL